MPGPGGGVNSGGGGRGPGVDSVENVSSLENIADIGIRFFKTIREFVEWTFTPVGTIVRESEFLPDAILEVLPAWLEYSTLVECFVGSALFFVLIGLIIRWIRQCFLL